jgi:hypothetical protein
MAKNKDRLIIGLQAGGFGTVFKEFGGLVALWINAKHTYWDYAAVLIYGRRAESPGEYAFAVIIQFVFSATLAVGYAYFERFFPTEKPIIKGGIFGGSIWLIIQAVIIINKIQPLQGHTLRGAIAEFLVATIFGAIIGWWVERKTR